MDLGPFRRDAHFFRAAPGDGAEITVGKPLRLDDIPVRLVELRHGVGNFEAEDLGRSMQPLAVLRGRKNLAVIDARALEHAASVMKGVRQHMDLRLAPRYQRAINPYEAVPLIIRNE